MYTPSPFKATREQALEFIQQQGFGVLCSIDNGKVLSTPLPYWVSPSHDALVFHLAHANIHWQSLSGALIQVMGPHAYISPTLYEGTGVPTWNYQSAEIRGNCSIISDAGQKRQLLAQMTEHFEKTQAQPWQVTFQDRLLKAIVMIEMKIESIEGKFKLSQNRSEQDQVNVKHALLAKGNPLASVMP